MSTTSSAPMKQEDRTPRPQRDVDVDELVAIAAGEDARDGAGHFVSEAFPPLAAMIACAAASRAIGTRNGEQLT